MTDGQLLVVEGWELATHKTQALNSTLLGLGVKGSALLVGVENSEKLGIAARKNHKLGTIESLGVNV